MINGHYPDWTVPRLTISPPDSSPTDHFPDYGQFPNRTVPRLTISPTGQFPDRTFPRNFFFIFQIFFESFIRIFKIKKWQILKTLNSWRIITLIIYKRNQEFVKNKKAKLFLKTNLVSLLQRFLHSKGPFINYVCR